MPVSPMTTLAVRQRLLTQKKNNALRDYVKFCMWFAASMLCTWVSFDTLTSRYWRNISHFVIVQANDSDLPGPFDR